MKKTFYVLTCALSTLLVLPAAAQVPSYVPTDGLVGWWPFNGNANDESGNGNDGVVNGATLTEDRNGNNEQAYAFNSSSINVQMTEQLHNLPVRSFSCWFFADGDQNGGRIYESTYLNGGIAMVGNTMDCWYYNGPFECNVIGFSTGPLQTWHHLAYITNSNNGQGIVFIDGVMTSQRDGGNFNAPQNWQGAFMQFGMGAQNEAYTGSLDDIAIYNRALTEQEIQNLYTGTTPPPCVSLPSNLQQGLVGYWPFCGNANDESGNGNDGVVYGATLTEDRFGSSDRAYSFDGNSNYISIPNSVPLPSNDITLNSWFLLSPSYSDGNMTILSKLNHENATSFSYGLGLDSLTIKKRFNYSSIGCSDFAGFGGDGIFTNIESSSSTWNMLTTSVTNSGQVNLFINGVLVDQYQGTPFVSCEDVLSTIHFGQWWDSDNQWFFGSLDDIGIWNRALTPEEVQELYTLDACTFTVYDTVTVYETVYDTVYTYETIYDTVTTYLTVTDTLLIDITFTGFEGQPSWLNTVTVFPNPASDHITIDYGNFALMAGYNTIITDAAGATVYSSAVNSQQVEIDINAWGAMGVYYMSVYDANGALVAVRHIVLE